MQRLMCCVLFFLLIRSVSFSQSIKENIGFQIDNIASSIKDNKIFVISAYLYNQIYIITRAKDSLRVLSYSVMIDGKIGRVYSVSVNDDTLLTKTVDSLYGDVIQSNSYQSYSKEILTGRNFFLTFYEKNKLEIFYDKNASQNQLVKMGFIVDRLMAYLVIPNNRPNDRLKGLKIKNFDELLKYFKDGTVDNTPK